MIKTLRESKAKLSELVELASRGQEILISVRGRVKARLTRATGPVSAPERAAWVRKLEKLQKACRGSASRPTVDEILAEQRDDRV